MGCNSSSPQEDEAAVAAAEKQRKRDAANVAMNAPKLDPADFMLCKLKGQTIIKQPGSIRGQQFIIEDCEDCTIFLLDHSATVSIDECKNCNIFVGPCESSVFVRTSSKLKLIIAAQQLRSGREEENKAARRSHIVG
jgi:protein XRP2